ncbi:MAG: transglutaminase-like domain-containing protein [Candidatus Firestonebacteria bacterium]|nr:transglutaminase-like domain-containing protein [Candidatus Firestonebacteria bacterium]
MCKILKAYCIAILFLAPLFGETFSIPQYFNIFINNSKAGYSSVILEKAKYNGKECIKETDYLLLDLKRLKDSIRIETTAELYYTENLLPLGFKSVESMTGQIRKIEGKVEKNKLLVTVKMAGAIEKKEFDFPAGTLFDDMVDDVLRKTKPVLNSKSVIKIFDKSNMMFVDVKVNIKDKVKEIINGKEYSGYRVETEMYGILVFHMIDESGVTLKSGFPRLGMTSILTSEADAKKTFRANIDLLSDFAIIASRPVSNPKMVKEMNCSIIFSEGLPKALNKESIKNTSIRILKDNMAICTLRRTEFDQTKALMLPIKEKGLEYYLKETAYEQAEDAGIKSTALGIAGKETNSHRVAALIVNWVYVNIKKKNFSIGFDSAKEVLAKKEGDCTEHAVLASALCKAAGIPTKICGGLMPVENRFFYHMWLEIYTGNGNWVPMDPTYNETILDAAHIKISEGILNDEGKFKLLLDILTYLKKTEIQVFKLEYLREGR